MLNPTIKIVNRCHVISDKAIRVKTFAPGITDNLYKGEIVDSVLVGYILFEGMDWIRLVQR
jgi:hypothetical protein